MLFSVLIPMYNSIKYISECLNSILTQDFQDYEIVIVDDGSNDGSQTICDAFQNRYPDKIRVIHKNNEGVLLTRRRAIKEAIGDYCLWVDSDDVIKSGLMETLAEQITQNSPDLIIYDYEFYNDSESVIHSMQEEDMYILGPNEKQRIYTQILTGRDMNELWTKCIKKTLFDLSEDYSQFANVTLGDDMFLLFPVLTGAQKIEYLRRPFYRYRTVDSSITHSTTYASYYSYRTVFERAASYMQIWGIPEAICNKARDQFIKRFLSCIINAGKMDIGYREFKNFAKTVLADERNRPIYSTEKRRLASMYLNLCYHALQHKNYLILFMLVKIVSVIR